VRTNLRGRSLLRRGGHILLRYGLQDGKDKAISATALAKRADRRIKRFLLKFLKS